MCADLFDRVQSQVASGSSGSQGPPHHTAVYTMGTVTYAEVPVSTTLVYILAIVAIVFGLLCVANLTVLWFLLRRRRRSQTAVGRR
jgi:hypothetical protein